MVQVKSRSQLKVNIMKRVLIFIIGSKTMNPLIYDSRQFIKQSTVINLTALLKNKSKR